eukprot:1203823-Rhodomonas_salina.2
MLHTQTTRAEIFHLICCFCVRQMQALRRPAGAAWECADRSHGARDRGGSSSVDSRRRRRAR